MAHVMRIREASGDQSATSSEAFVCVTCRLFEPLTFITHTWNRCVASRWEYAMVLPSGDHAGLTLRLADPVSTCRPVPSNRETQIADQGRLREHAKARRFPPGAHAGWAASRLRGVIRLRAAPDASITKIARCPVPG